MNPLPSDALDELVGPQKAVFRPLRFSGIDNEPVFAAQGRHLRQEESCLFFPSVADADTYLDRLAQYIDAAMSTRSPAAVVRFADGEYAFYNRDLSCNGLYRQAESKRAIVDALPLHRAALAELMDWGLAAPLIHPGNTRPIATGLGRLWKKSSGDSGARHFLRFLGQSGSPLTDDHYLPFYAVYAYLTSERFARCMDGKHIALISADLNLDACYGWFRRRGVSVTLTPVDLPHEYVATQWHRRRDAVLAGVPTEADLVLVGAGIGALLVCVDVARLRSTIAIDGGHVINMMNGQTERSKGPRLFTVWKTFPPPAGPLS